MNSDPDTPLPVGAVRWPDDIPPPEWQLVYASRRLLDDVNDLAQEHPHRTAFEHGVIELLRSQAIVIKGLARQQAEIASSIGEYPDCGDSDSGADCGEAASPSDAET